MSQQSTRKIMATSLMLITTLVGLTLSRAALAQTLIIESILKPPLSNTEGTGLIDLITKERFARIGANIEIHHIPSTRALEQTNAGIYDGDIMRVAGTSATYPNLIQVPGSIYHFDFVAFAKNPDIKVSGWDSLKPYNVAVPEGWVETDNNLSAANTTSLIKLSSPPQLFSTLQRSKVDLSIYERLMGYDLLKDLNLKTIHVLEPPLSSKEMFLYLNKKHADLVPKLEEALKAMQADGTLQKLTDQVLAQYQDQIATPE